MIRRLLTLLFSSLLVSQAQAVESLTISDAILLAFAQNTNIINAHLQRALDRYDLKVAHWQYQPHFSLVGEERASSGAKLRSSGGMNASMFLPNGSTLDVSGYADNDKNISKVMTLTTPLWKNYGIDINLIPLHDAEDQELISQLALQSVLQQTLSEVVYDFRRVIQADKNIAVQKMALDQSQELLRSYQTKVRIGELAKTSLDQQEALVISQQLDINQLENHKSEQYRQLMLALGLNYDDVPQLVQEKELDEHPLPPLSQCIKTALAHNISYQQNLIGLKLLERALMRAKNQQNPDVSLALSYADNRSYLYSDDPSYDQGYYTSKQKQANLSWRIPLNDRSQRQALLSARTNLTKYKHDLDYARAELVAQVKNSYENLTYQSRQLALYQQKLAMDKKNYSVTVKSHLSGLSSAYEVVAEQQILTDSELGYNNMKLEYLNELIEFHGLLGDLIEYWGFTKNDFA